MKKILMISTGGTIASKPTIDGLIPCVDGNELLKLVPEIKDICLVDVVQLINFDSTNMRPGHWLKIAEKIQDEYDNYDGFVITHGTDTLSYTAAGLSYLIQNSKKPIVLTGAQVPLCLSNSDAGRNLIDSFTYACDDESNGVVIVFSGSIICGTRARKNYTKRFDAFVSVNFPELGRIQNGKILRFINENPNDNLTFYDYLNPNVGLIKFVPVMRKDVLNYLLDTYDGVVIESFGVGGIPEYSDFYGVIEKAVNNGKTIVLTTQVPNEGSDLSLYHVGNVLKKNCHILEAYDMTSESALAKLMWVLGQSDKQGEIEKLFYTRIHHDLLSK